MLPATLARVRQWILSVFLVLCWLGPACAEPRGDSLPEGIRSMEFVPERDFGQTVGALIRVEIAILADPALTLDTGALPHPGDALNEWLEIRDVSWTEEEREDGRLLRLSLVYQVFKGVRSNETFEVPGVSLRFRRGEAAVELLAPPWRFTLMPLIPPDLPDEGVVIRPELSQQPLSAVLARRGVAFGSSALLALLGVALWLKGLPPFASHSPEPFARAARQLKALGKAPAGEARERNALRIVHGALNDRAGRSVFAADLEALVAEFPELAAFRPELERFFRRSRALFFEGAGPLEPHAPDLPWLEALCRRCHARSRRKP